MIFVHSLREPEVEVKIGIKSYTLMLSSVQGVGQRGSRGLRTYICSTSTSTSCGKCVKYSGALGYEDGLHPPEKNSLSILHGNG